MSRKYDEIASQGIPRIEERSAYALPSPDLEYLFKVTGKILVTDIVGEVMQIPYIVRVDTITVTGTGGTATVVCDGVTKTLTFDTDIETSIDNFVTDNAAAYLSGGVILTKGESDEIVFKSNSQSLNFTGNTTITNATDDLAGTVAATVPWVINTKLIANPTVGADVDMCADLNIIGAAVGSLLSITGNPANAMQYLAGGCATYNPFKMIVHGGTIDLNTVVTPSQGMIKWTLHYIPIDKDASVEPIHKYWYESL